MNNEAILRLSESLMAKAKAMEREALAAQEQVRHLANLVLASNTAVTF